jgi:thioredoxin-like negative regulator of GroEL
MLSQALYVQGKRDEALVLAVRSLEIAEEAGQEEAAGHFRELVEVMSHAEGGASVPKDVHDRIQAAIATAQRGDITAAAGALDALAEEAKAADDSGSEATVRIVLGQILHAVGDRDGAAAHLRRALTIAEAIGDQAAADHVRGMLENDPS